MASRRYSSSDLQKMKADVAANLRAKGVDAREIHVTHPGGVVAGLKEMTGNISATRDQSQEQTEKNRAGMKLNG